MEEVGMRNKHIFHGFDDSEELVKNLCVKICYLLKKSLKINERASIAFSGGSTPKKLLQKMSSIDIEWQRVDVTLVDERWVDVDSPLSNEHLVRENFLQGRAQKANFISLKNEMSSAQKGVEGIKKRLQKIKKLDIVVLGMGKDAHTASFFPHMSELEEALDTKDLCLATTANVEPTMRLTLSRSFLLSATALILHIEGWEKELIFKRALESDDYKSMPIISMMQQENPILEVYHA
ncbi:6-phosphogluconolactonase [Sulfurimonas aquatica]|nr:6-phosphogluconolactonase [Sulfurimonas aquatica]